MADFDFFDQFRDKMRSLRPSESTAGEDWQALSQRLDANMPVVATPTIHRYRWAAAALLLLLLGSNLWWGFTFRAARRKPPPRRPEPAATDATRLDTHP